MVNADQADPEPRRDAFAFLGIGIVIDALHVAHEGVLPKFIPVGLPDLPLEQRLPLLPTRYVSEALSRCRPWRMAVLASFAMV